MNPASVYSAEENSRFFWNVNS